MSDGSDSSASRAFAERLAKYAYQPGPSRSSPRFPRAVSGPSSFTPDNIKPEPLGNDDMAIEPCSEDGLRRSRGSDQVVDEAGPSTPSKRPRSRQGEHVVVFPSTRERSAAGAGAGSPDSKPASTARLAVKSRLKGDQDQVSPKRTKPSPKKPRPYAGPEVYAHLKPIIDHAKPGMVILFCGINPGESSAMSQ